MRRIASLLGRVLVGIAAAAFLLGATLFLLGLHLSLRAGRSQPYRKVALAVEIAERAAELALAARAESAPEDQAPTADRRPSRRSTRAQDQDVQDETAYAQTD